MDKVKKVLIIVFLALSIASLVFTLMKKTGLCAEPPLPVIAKESNFPEIDGYTYSDFMEDFNNLNLNYSNIVIYYYEDNGHHFRVLIFPYSENYLTNDYQNITPNSYITISDANTRITSGNKAYIGNGWSGGVVIRYYDLNMTTKNLVFVSNNEYGWYILSTSTVINRKYFYCKNDIYTDNTNNNELIFTMGESTPPHNKGGILAEMTENDEIAEEELTGVDTTTPSDPTNNSAWYQKILNAIGRVNTSIQGGIITTTDYLKQLISGQRDFKLDLLATLGVISGKLDGISQGTPEEIASDWLEGYEDSSLYEIKTTFEHTKGGVQAMFTPSSNALVLGNWSLYRSGEHLYLEGIYTLPAVFGGQQQHITLNFDWYNSIKSWFVPLVVSLMTIGLTVTIFKGMPSMIQGAGTTFKTINDKESK